MTDIALCSDVISNLETAQTLFCAVSDSSEYETAKLVAAFLSPAILTIGVIVALHNIKSAKETARRRATLDMIEKVESMPHYQKMHATFAYRRRTDSFMNLIEPSEAKDRDERSNVHDYLNHYELVSIGIKNEILDEATYKAWMKGPFVRDWNAATEFIQRERWKYDGKNKKWLYRKELFEHFQELAMSWSKDAICINATTSSPPETPSGPGDESYPAGKQSEKHNC